MLFPTVLSIALLPLAFAQDAPLGIKAIEAHFNQSHLVPDLFATFQPTALLTLNYPGVGELQPGQKLTKEQTGPWPAVKVTAANSTDALSGKYTLAMVDADIVGSDASKGETRHWLVNGVTIANNEVTNTTATSITDYAGPWPAAGSGPHRYVVALYEQPSTFSAPAGFAEPIGVSVFDFNAYVKDSGLGPLVAATYLTVEEGTATMSIPATAAVNSATLAPASTSTSKTGTTTSSGSPSATDTKTGDATAVRAGFFYLVMGAVVTHLLM